MKARLTLFSDITILRFQFLVIRQYEFLFYIPEIGRIPYFKSEIGNFVCQFDFQIKNGNLFWQFPLKVGASSDVNKHKKINLFFEAQINRYNNPYFGNSITGILRLMLMRIKKLRNIQCIFYYIDYTSCRT